MSAYRSGGDGEVLDPNSRDYERVREALDELLSELRERSFT